MAKKTKKVKKTPAQEQLDLVGRLTADLARVHKR